MKYLKISYPKNLALSLEKFRDMDYYAVNNYFLPIELMMENAGLQLANLVASFADKNQVVKIGVGNGNNGGGGLVAARRLASWGYSVYIDAFTEITKEIPLSQLQRAIKFGVKQENIANPDIWIDAYLGFSQRLPLKPSLVQTIEDANSSSAIKVSLDIPTGFLGNTEIPYFQAAKVLSLAAPKKILYHLPSKTEIFIADLGIPKEVYAEFNVEALPFYKSNIIQIKPQNHE